MAKRKRRHSSHKRRRVSGPGKGIAMKIAGVTAGVFAARLLSTKVIPSTISPMIANGGLAIIGIMVPKYMKSELGQGIGDGILAAGALGLLQGAGVIGAVQPPGQSALVRQGNNGYNPALAKAVGAPRPFINNAVGRMNGVPKKTPAVLALGALMDE